MMSRCGGMMVRRLACVFLLCCGVLSRVALGSWSGWAVGDTDGEGVGLLAVREGGDWFRQGGDFLPPEVRLGGVAAVRPGKVWVVGEPEGGYASIWHSADAGESWERQGSEGDVPALELLKIRAVNEHVLWAVGMEGLVLRTTSGGAEWMDVSPGGVFTQQLQAVSAADGQVAWVGGGDLDGYAVLLHTVDGGSNWVRQTVGGITNVLHLLGLHAVSATAVWGIGGGHQDIIASFDGGETWETKFRGAENRDGNEIFVDAGGTVWAATDSSVLWSADLGASWESTMTEDYTMGVASPDGERVWAVRGGPDGGSIYYSPDAGTTWDEQVADGIPALLDVAMIHTEPRTLHVATNSLNPMPPYGDWETAARDIQTAVDLAAPGDTVLVARGAYRQGTRPGLPAGDPTPARVVIDKAIRVEAVAGAGETTIHGERQIEAPELAVRGVYLAPGAELVGFAVMQGSTAENRSGGGIYAADRSAVIRECLVDFNYAAEFGGGLHGGTVYDTVFTRNRAPSGGAVNEAMVIRCRFEGNEAFNSGGAIRGGDVWNSFVIDNSAGQTGGGVWRARLYNTLVAGNRAVREGGGVWGSRVHNCTVYGNRVAETGGGGGIALADKVSSSIVFENYDDHGVVDNYLFDEETQTIQFSCSYPRPSGPGNTEVDPRFAMDTERTNQPPFYLLPLSPGIDGGTNMAWMVECEVRRYDLHGNPRIYPEGGVVDMGAYEWQGLGWGDRGYAPTNESTVRVTAVMDLDYRFVTTNMTGWRELTIYNDGPGPMEVLRLRYPHGYYSGQFAGIIPAHASTSVMVRFHPETTGIRQGTVHVDTYATHERTGDDTLHAHAVGTHMRIPDEWLLGYGFETNTAHDYILREDFNDDDGDTFTVWEEWRAETVPTNPASFFEFRHAGVSTEEGYPLIRWVSASNRTYRVRRATSLYQRFVPPVYRNIATNVPGVGPPGAGEVVTFADTNAPRDSFFFYRVEVEEDPRGP